MLGGGNEEQIIKNIEITYLNKIKIMIDTRLEELQQVHDITPGNNSITYGNASITFIVQEFDDEILIIVNDNSATPQYYSSIKDKMYNKNIMYMEIENSPKNIFLNKLFTAIPTDKISELNSLESFLQTYINQICPNSLLYRRLHTIIVQCNERKNLSSCIFDSYMEQSENYGFCKDGVNISLLRVPVIENGNKSISSFSSSNLNIANESLETDFVKLKEKIINMFTIYNLKIEEKLSDTIYKLIDINRTQYNKLKN
jgi:hypothetical protein